MNSDQIMLLVGVDGFVLAVLFMVLALMSPAEKAAGDVVGEIPLGSSRERLVSPLLAGLLKLGLRLSPQGAAAKVQHRLDIAGNPTGWYVEKVFVVKGMLMFGLAVFGLALGRFTLVGLLMTVGFGVVGFFLPDVLLYNTGTKRQLKIQQALPDTIDLLAVSMKAGLGFDGAVGKVAQAIDSPLAAEFGRYLQELRLGASRPEALQALSERSTVTDLHHIVSSLAQADQLGIPVAKVLEQQAKEMRVKRRQRAEEKAQKVTIKILFPTIFCIFPALFVAVIGPGAIRLSETLFSGGGGLS